MSINLESLRHTSIAPFFVLSGLMEMGAGAGLLLAPDFAIGLIFGPSGTAAAVALARLAGVALVSLGCACWLARHDGTSASSRALVSAMSTYNSLVVALVLTGSLGPLGLMLSGVALLHGAMSVWCVLLLRGV
jgi:hypothetical protein